MGADITFENGEYFRDSYNDSSLAWVIGLSYWQDDGHNDFMKQMANITDNQIIERVRKLYEKRIDNDSGEWLVQMLKQKRDFLKALDEKGELKVAEDGWSV